MKVALIVGHERKAQGGSNMDGTTEYTFNKELAQRIAPVLISMNFEPVIIYRDGTTYSKLPAKVNKVNPDIAVSLHCNAFNRLATGTETLHYINSERSQRLALCMQRHMVKALGLRDRGLRPVNAKHKGRKGDKGGHLCKYTNMPTVILEPCFIDNNKDLATARANFDALALAIANGVKDYAEN